MPNALAQEIAKQILDQGILYNWKFYLILLAVMLLGTAASTFLSTFIRKRAETYATKADLGELIAQLRATTSAAEEVRTAISHTDWATREWKAIRRTKLEELLKAVYAIRHWLDCDMNAKFFSGPAVADPSPIRTVEALSDLYFPELAREVNELARVHNAYMTWMLEAHKKLLAVPVNDLAGRKQVMDEFMLPYVSDQHTRLLQAAQVIELRAPALMREVAGV